MLRRSSSKFLPHRTDLKRVIEFGQQEAETYREAKSRTLNCLDNVLEANHSKDGYINALQKINTLRLICNLGYSNLYGGPMGMFSHKFAEGFPTLGQFPLLGLDTICVNCRQPVDTVVGDSETVQFLHLTKCLRLWCMECCEELSKGTRLCNCQPACDSVRLSLESQSPSSIEFAQVPAEGKNPPTKVQALIQDLTKQSRGTKRYGIFLPHDNESLTPHSIVFSFWKATLDVAHAALNAAGIPCVQVDGTIPRKRRTEIFDQFSSEKDVQVLLLTLSCGAVG